MPAVLKNILSFTGLVVGVPSVQAHGLNIPARGGVVPRVLETDGAGYTVTADDTNVTVTRGSNAAASVNVYCEYWHSIEDAEPQPNGIATSIYPFVVQGGGSAGGGAGGITALSGGTTFGTGPTIVFQDGGNVTFGMNGNTLTASVQTAGGTATGVGLSAGTQSVDTGVVRFVNSNGLSFGMSGSSQITGAYSQSTAPNAIAVNAAGSVTAGTVVFSNSNNITFGLNGSTITASASASQSTGPAAIAAAGSTGTSGTIIFSNSNNISFGMNGNTITATVAGGGETPFGISAGTQSNSTGTVVFSNSNGVTFGMSNNSIVTASVSSLVYSNSNNVSFGVNGSTLTATASMSSVVFSNSNNVSFGLNGSTITASASFSGAGGGVAMAAGTQTATSGTVVMSDSNGMVFGMSGSTRVTGRVFSLSATGAELVSITAPAGMSWNVANRFDATVSAGFITASENMAIAAGTDASVYGNRHVIITANNSNISVIAKSNILLFASNLASMTGQTVVLDGAAVVQIGANSTITARAPHITIGGDNKLSVYGGSSGIVFAAQSSGISMSAAATNGVVAMSVGSQIDLLAGASAEIVIDGANSIVNIQNQSNGKLGFFGVAGSSRPTVSTSSDLTAWVSRLNLALVNLGLVSTV